MTTTARPGFDRRSFLRYSMLTGGAVGALGVTGALSACSAGAGDGDGGGASSTNPRVQLSWQKNVQFSGMYFAIEKGYFEEEGLGTPELLTGGGPGSGVETGLTSNSVWVGTTSPQLTAPVVLQGAELKTVGATFQRNPFCIMSAADNAIMTPQEMTGKRIGVQASNENVFAALLKANDMQESDLTKITVQYDPTPLTAGEVDGWVSYVTNEPIALGERGFANEYFMFADFNLPLVGEAVVVRQETIDNERDQLKGFLKAIIRGWYDARADPAEAARLAVEVYGPDLGNTIDGQVKEFEAQTELMVTPDTEANGLLTITDELIAENIAALASADITIAAEDLFDTSIINEVYAENPDLIP